MTPDRIAVEGNLSDFVSREKDRKRREIESAKEWKYFNAWWEAYKIELAKAPATIEGVGPKAVADRVEQEYRQRYDSTYAVVEAIWKDFVYP